MCIGEILDKLMKKRGISQNSLDRVSGVPQSTIGRLIRGTAKDPRFSTVVHLADALDVSTDYFRLGGEPYSRGELSSALHEIREPLGSNNNQLVFTANRAITAEEARLFRLVMDGELSASALDALGKVVKSFNDSGK